MVSVPAFTDTIFKQLNLSAFTKRTANIGDLPENKKGFQIIAGNQGINGLLLKANAAIEHKRLIFKASFQAVKPGSPSLCNTLCTITPKIVPANGAVRFIQRF